MTQTKKDFLLRRLRRAGLLCALICITGLLLSATARADEQHLRPVRLQLRWHHQFQFAGYYMAKQLGYYRDAGLDVEIRAGGSDISPVRELLAGRADFGIEGSGLLVDYANGRPVVAVAAIFQKSPLRLVALRDRGISVLSDLSERKVMLLPGSRSLALIAMLDQAGLLNRIVRVDSSAEVSDLIEGRVDAFNAYNSNEPHILQQAGIEPVVFDPAAYGIQFYSDILFTDLHTAQSDPDLVVAFRDASLRGWQYALEHPEEAIDLIVRQWATDKSRPLLRLEADGVRESVMADLVEIGHISELRWIKIRDQLSGLGLVPKGQALEGFIFRPAQTALDWATAFPYVLGAVTLLAVVFAVMAYVMRKNARLQEEVEQHLAAEQHARDLATHDYLTGLPNRLLLTDRLNRSLARARRHLTTPLIALVDLDNFKQINDRYGHDRGDQLLIEIARQVQQAIREEDTFVRMGGDEFVLLVDHIEPQQADFEARRLMQAIRSASARVAADAPVSASIGLVCVAKAGDITSDRVLRLADDLMYEVKHGSKNGFLVGRYDGSETLVRTVSSLPKMGSDHVSE